MIIMILLIPISIMAVSGFIPQGKKLPNGQMDSKTIVTISRDAMVNFIDSGTIPENIIYIYNSQWKNSLTVRKQYAQLLRNILEQKTGIDWDHLKEIILDQNQSPAIQLDSKDTVISNGIGYSNGKLSIVPAPTRLARTTADNSLETYIILPNNIFIYMTCLNIDIKNDNTGLETTGEESIPVTQIKTDTVYYVTRDTVINNYEIKTPSPPITIYDTVYQNKVIIHQNDKQVINNYHYKEQPRVIKKTVVMYYDDCGDCQKLPKPNNPTVVPCTQQLPKVVGCTTLQSTNLPKVVN